jgi:hypothetical protein
VTARWLAREAARILPTSSPIRSTFDGIPCRSTMIPSVSASFSSPSPAILRRSTIVRRPVDRTPRIGAEISITSAMLSSDSTMLSIDSAMPSSPSTPRSMSSSLLRDEAETIVISFDPLRTSAPTIVIVADERAPSFDGIEIVAASIEDAAAEIEASSTQLAFFVDPRRTCAEIIEIPAASIEVPSKEHEIPSRRLAPPLDALAPPNESSPRASEASSRSPTAERARLDPIERRSRRLR